MTAGARVTESCTRSCMQQQGDGIRGERARERERKLSNRRGRREGGRQMDRMSKIKGSKFTSRSVSVSCHLPVCRENERRNEEEEEDEENYKFWFFSFQVSSLSHHFICPPTPGSSFASLFFLCHHPPLVTIPPFLLWLSLSRSIFHLFVRPKVCNTALYLQSMWDEMWVRVCTNFRLV